MYFFLVLFILGGIPSICKGQHENTCNVVPKDKYIEVGSDVDIVCQTSCVHGKIFWTINNRSVDKSLSNTINSSHTVLSLRNFTHQNAILQCHSEDIQQVLGGTTVKTYSKPSNISCFLHKEDQTREGSPDQITCKWEHEVNPSMDVNYVLRASSSEEPLNQFEICKSNSTNCNNKIDLLLIDHTITVRAKTFAWEVDSDPYTFNSNHILKMIPPQLKEPTVSDDLLVEWEWVDFSKWCRCQVKYSKVVNGRTSEWVINKNLTKVKHGNVTIEKVESCSNYTFSVRCALDKAPWSDWSQEKVLTTKLNKRDVKLRLWRKIDELDNNGVRKVHAMWTEIPSTCQDKFTYTIKQTPYKEHMVGVNYMDTLCGKSTCDVDVSKDAHRINLTVHNKALLEFMDSVYVPAIGESLPQITDIQTSTLEGIILVSWKAPIQPVSGYMIDWTHNGNQYQWKESNDTNTALSNLLDKTPYNITVTPLFDDKTGHGTQALQICSRVADPGNVTIHVKANDKSALVSWNVSQEACSDGAVNYTVFYRTQDGGPQLNITVDGTERVTSLKDLNPDTQYSVYVKATALTGTTKSSENSFKTKRFGPEFITAVSVCGSFIILLVLSLGLCCAVQWKKFREKVVPNPGNSSVASWPALSRQEGMCPFQPFSNPTESLCDRVYTEETQRMSISPLATGCNGNLMSDQTDEYVDPGTVPAPDEQNEDLVNHAETQHLSSPDDSTELLSSETSPYRSQTFVESPASKPINHCKRVPVKQPEKTALVTVYVTLDMFQQGQGR